MLPRVAIIAALLLVPACGSDKRAISLRDSARLGNRNAPVEIIVFSDFQCPFCRRAADELERLVAARPGRIKVYFKHFPIARHPMAMEAALAAEAARLQGRFWDMHDALFAHQAELEPGIFARLAAEMGLDVERFVRDMESDEAARAVEADRAEGERAGVDGTPFFFVNRKPFLGSYADLAARVDGIGGRE